VRPLNSGAANAPPFAIRLMEYAGADSAVIGDLVEAFTREHEVAWFWRQTANILIRRFLAMAVAALRWLILVPSVILAIVIEWWIVVVRAHDRMMILPAAFVIAATLVKLSTWIAPSRKDPVRRIALSVVIVCGVAEAFMNQLLGFTFIPFLFWVGVFAVIGGTLAYFSASEFKTLAAWLLEHSGADPAIIGDINEEFARGRSSAWFWRQVVNVLARKHVGTISIGRTGGAVLIICGTLFAFISPLLGVPFVLLGALGFVPPHFFYREVKLTWLEGLTRPRRT
jgi:predicted ribosomally synthesized peptide with SipW-like signal peptide